MHVQYMYMIYINYFNLSNQNDSSWPNTNILKLNVFFAHVITFRFPVQSNIYSIRFRFKPAMYMYKQWVNDQAKFYLSDDTS